MSFRLLRRPPRAVCGYGIRSASIHPLPPGMRSSSSSVAVRTKPKCRRRTRPVALLRRQQQHQRWASTTSAFPWADRSYGFLYPRIQQERRSESESPFLLATSASTAATKEKRNILHRIARWIRRALQRCRDVVLVTIRGSEIVLRLSPLLLLTPASVAAARCLDTHKVSDWTWTYARSAVTALGPAFVKLCQWVATRRDIFAPFVCDRLAVLQDSGLPHRWGHTDRALRAAFGDDYQQRGLRVDHRNGDASLIGCGSAAQVYKGTLRIKTSKDDDEAVELRPVAIKVLHPRLEELIDRDLWFVQTVANLLHSLPSEHVQMLNLPRAVSNFGAILRRQADLTLEADNLTRFRHNFYRYDDEDKTSKILFPKPMENWVSTDVLVEDLVDHATPIAEFLNDSTEAGVQARKELASPLLRAFLKMIFIDNFIHCGVCMISACVFHAIIYQHEEFVN